MSAAHFTRAARLIIVSDLPFAGMTMRQIAVLAYITDNNGSATVRGTANALGLTKPVITRALDSLGRIGLIQRHRDPLDRRNVFISITNRGTAATSALSALLSTQGTTHAN